MCNRHTIPEKAKRKQVNVSKRRKWGKVMLNFVNADLGVHHGPNEAQKCKQP